MVRVRVGCSYSMCCSNECYDLGRDACEEEDGYDCQVGVVVRVRYGYSHGACQSLKRVASI